MYGVVYEVLQEPLPVISTYKIPNLMIPEIYTFFFKVVTTAGWGQIGYNQRLSPELRSLNLTVTAVRFIHIEWIRKII